MREFSRDRWFRSGRCEHRERGVRHDAGRSFALLGSVNRYNFSDRSSDDVLAVCEKEGIAFLPWHPLAAGGHAAGGGALGRVACRHGATPVQVAIAWLLARSPVMVPIPGNLDAGPSRGECCRRLHSFVGRGSQRVVLEGGRQSRTRQEAWRLETRATPLLTFNRRIDIGGDGARGGADDRARTAVRIQGREEGRIHPAVDACRNRHSLDTVG